MTLASTQREGGGAPPAEECRTTMASTPMACSVWAVSLKDSPFDREDLASPVKLITSAERRLAASSKEIRVRVEDSKNRLHTVRPLRIGTFLIVRVPTSLQ